MHKTVPWAWFGHFSFLRLTSNWDWKRKCTKRIDLLFTTLQKKGKPLCLCTTARNAAPKYNTIKRHWHMVIVKDQYSHLVYPNINTQISENLGSIGHQISRKLLKKKHPCCTNLCAFRCLSKTSGLKSFSDIKYEITSFSKTVLLQSEWLAHLSTCFRLCAFG